MKALVLESINNFTQCAEEYGYTVEVTECHCGAYTMDAVNSRGTTENSITFMAENAPSYMKPTTNQVWCGCNHCVNDWGIDIEPEEEEEEI